MIELNLNDKLLISRNELCPMSQNHELKYAHGLDHDHVNYDHNYDQGHCQL